MPGERLLTLVARLEHHRGQLHLAKKALLPCCEKAVQLGLVASKRGSVAYVQHAEQRTYEGRAQRAHRLCEHRVRGRISTQLDHEHALKREPLLWTHARGEHGLEPVESRSDAVVVV